MAVDYRDQYTRKQLEPFWPNEIIKMVVVVLCTLTVIMAFVALPTVLEWAGVEGLVHEEEPANPRVTPEHIKPEWYFLAVYQYLKLMEYPQQWFGIDGKLLGVLSQGVFVVAVVALPFWYRRKSHRAMTIAYYTVVTIFVALFLILTIWAIWPPNPLFVALTALAVVVFTALMIQERRNIRRLLHDDHESKVQR
ncbi:MAG: hypothetical protein HUU22_13680 [Phycisphaerae bacterium]|nr:hypothetical protein [Phycisphaerae bacterium]NUQ47071.1 hypothetical protein [Phycisphaerae bacterium]